MQKQNKFQPNVITLNRTDDYLFSLKLTLTAEASNNNNNNTPVIMNVNNCNNNVRAVYGAIIVAEILQEFIRLKVSK